MANDGPTTRMQALVIGIILLGVIGLVALGIVLGQYGI